MGARWSRRWRARQGPSGPLVPWVPLVPWSWAPSGPLVPSVPWRARQGRSGPLVPVGPWSWDLCRGPFSIFLERLSSGDSIKLAEHRGEFQTIDRQVLSFIFQLQRSSFSFCAGSYIGRAASEEYIQALTKSELSAVIPALFVIFDRRQRIWQEDLKRLERSTTRKRLLISTTVLVFLQFGFAGDLALRPTKARSSGNCVIKLEFSLCVSCSQREFSNPVVHHRSGD